MLASTVDAMQNAEGKTVWLTLKIIFASPAGFPSENWSNILAEK